MCEACHEQNFDIRDEQLVDQVMEDSAFGAKGCTKTTYFASKTSKSIQIFNNIDQIVPKFVLGLRAQMAAQAFNQTQKAAQAAERLRRLAAGESLDDLEKAKKSQLGRKGREQARSNPDRHLAIRFRSAKSMLAAFQTLLRHMTNSLVDNLNSASGSNEQASSHRLKVDKKL
mgnify:CR=1 FL=1